jgi:hypothetical protein
MMSERCAMWDLPPEGVRGQRYHEVIPMVLF